MDDPAPIGRYGRRRPRPGLTPAAIITAGRQLIERDGLEALTMRAVAAELGTAPMSLYRHIADRDALLLAILEQIAAGLPVQVPGDTPHQRLRRRFVDAHDYMAHHIWVLHVLIRGELVAETAFAFSDACLADLIDAGLPPVDAMAAFRACWQLTIGELLDQHPLHPPREPTQRQQALARVDPARLPALATVIQRLPRLRTPDDDFAHTIESLLSALLPATLDTEHARGA